MTQPRTAAGRALLDWLDFARKRGLAGIPQADAILAIESEASAEGWNRYADSLKAIRAEAAPAGGLREAPYYGECPVCGHLDAIRDAAHLATLADWEDARQIIVGLTDAFDSRWTGSKKPPPVYYKAQRWLARAALAAIPSAPHRPATNQEQQPGNGIFAGCCIVDGEIWPCSAASPSAAPLEVPTITLVKALYTSGLTDDMNPVERRKVALRLRVAIAAQGEKPDPLVTYTDPAGGPDWEPRRDEA